MFKTTKLATAVKASLLLGSVTLAPTLIAQEAPDSESAVERISITGSSIKRTDMEGALPITNITAEDIAKSGVTSVPDLIAQLPSMQGFTTPSESVGGTGGGVATAALRGISSEYTLVLLNGRRLASSDSGGSVNVNSIPIAAIERIEVLTDGASALYGADAIAGVINFILKKDIQETTVSARYDSPQESGGDNYSFSITSGYGDLREDGFNVFASASRETQKILRSVDRDFSKTGFIPFNYNDTDLMFVADSSNAIPGNARIRYTDPAGMDRDMDGEVDQLSLTINPFREANNDQCAENNAPSDSINADGTVEQRICRFDFTSTLEIIPEFTRDNLVVGGVVALGDNAELYSTLSYSNFSQTARIAPYPTGNFLLPNDSAIVQQQVLPLLDQEILDNLDDVAAAWRVLPGGNRTNEFTTETIYFNGGIRGEFDDISYDASLTYSDSEREDNIITGYPITSLFLPLVSSGQVNVFGHPDDLTDAEIELVQGTMFSGLDTVTETDMVMIEANASAPVFELASGDVYVGGGFDYREISYRDTGSESNQQAIILFTDPSPQFDLSRSSYGAFVETIVPVLDNLEVTGSLRYDKISDIDNENVTTGETSVVGKDVSDTTYKLSLAYRPNDDWLIRASIGTGFKAPTMREIAAPRITFGVTGNAYDCPFTSSQPLAQFCRPSGSQYDVFRQGNSELKPEESEQSSIGFVYSPDTDFSVTMDWWKIELTNQVERTTEGQIFGDPDAFPAAFTTRIDNGTGDTLLAIIAAPNNIGKSNIEGLDWSVRRIFELGPVNLVSRVAGTYMIENESLRAGTTDFFESSLGAKGTDDAVVFRNRIRIDNTFTYQDFSVALNVNYQSGYLDEYFPGGDSGIRLASDLGTNYTGGVQLSIPSYTTVDFLARYTYEESLVVGFGINNLTDTAPPLSIGENGGHQEGFDPRYFDAYGRTFYLTLDYTF